MSLRRSPAFGLTIPYEGQKEKGSAQISQHHVGWPGASFATQGEANRVLSRLGVSFTGLHGMGQPLAWSQKVVGHQVTRIFPGDLNDQSAPVHQE